VKYSALLVLAVSVGLMACSESEAPKPQQQAAAPAPAHPPVAQPATSANQGKVISNTVVGGYSYIEADSGGKSVWLAANRIGVKPGDDITWGNYAMMRKFTSKALNRTFDEILFVSSVSSDSLPQANATSGKVLSATDAAGYSYIEVEVPGGTKWLAAPVTKISQGDQVSWGDGAVMRNFSSSSLNRTFDEIVFVGGIKVAN
jgi:hypothetical protein